MGISVLTPEEAFSVLVGTFGVAEGWSVESVSATRVRRAASLMCPTTPAALAAAVRGVLQGLGSIDTAAIVELIDTLVASGDLVEVLEENGVQKRRMIYLGQPRFVRRRSGDLLVIGTRPDNAPLVGEALAGRISRTGYLRRILDPDREVYELLEAYGVHEIPEARWVSRPAASDARTLLESYSKELRQQGACGPIEGLRILDPKTSPSHYKSRWRIATSTDEGVFLARRSQGYGGDLWCVVAIRAGESQRLLDLPTTMGGRGCDEGWQLQAAIDATNGTPQEVSIRGTGKGSVELGLPAPPPRWLQRRWDLIGTAVHGRSSLVTYEISSRDARDEVALVCELLWMDRQVLPQFRSEEEASS